MAAALACMPAVARATEADDFRSAQQAYDRGEYARAVQLFEAMVGGETPSIRDRVLIRESRVYLAAAYVLTERHDAASRQFETLLRAEGPERYVLDPTRWSESVQTVYRDVRDRLVEEARTRQQSENADAAAREERRRAAALALLALAQEDVVEIQHDPALAWAPFGAGQFQNGNTDLGAFFAMSQAVTFVGAVATFGVWVALNDVREQARMLGDDAGISDSMLRGLQIANWTAVGAFLSLVGAGILEAHVNFVPSHRERRQREVPPDVLEGLDLSIGPTSVTARLRF